MSSSSGSVFTDWRLWMLGIALIVAFAIDVNRCQNEKRVRRANQYEADQRAWEDRQRQERLDRDEELRRELLERESKARTVPKMPEPKTPKPRDPSEVIGRLTVALNWHPLSQSKPGTLEFAYKNLGVPERDSITDFRKTTLWTHFTLPAAQTAAAVPLTEGFTAIKVSGEGLYTSYALVRVFPNGKPLLVSGEADDRGMTKTAFEFLINSVVYPLQYWQSDCLLREPSALKNWKLEFPILQTSRVSVVCETAPGFLVAKCEPLISLNPDVFHRNYFKAAAEPRTIASDSLAELSFLAPIGTRLSLNVPSMEGQHAGLSTGLINGPVTLTKATETLKLATPSGYHRAFNLASSRGKPVLRCKVYGPDVGMGEVLLYSPVDGTYYLSLPLDSPLVGKDFNVVVEGHADKTIRWADLPNDGTPLAVQLNRLTECIRIEIDYPIGATDRDRVRVNARVWDEELAQPRVISEILPESGEHEIPTKLPAKAEVTVTSDRHLIEFQSEGWDPDHKCRWFRYHTRPILSAHLMLGSRPLGAQWPSDTPIHVTISQWFPGGVFSSSVKDPTLAIWAKQPTEFLLSNPPYIPVTPGNWEVTVGAIHTDGLIHGWKRFNITDTQQPVTDVTVDNTNFSPWRSFKIKDETGRFTAAKAEFFWPQRGMGSVAEAAQWCSFKQDTLGRTATTTEIGRTLTPNRSAWVMTSHSPEYVVLPAGFRTNWWCLPPDRSGVYLANVDNDAHTITISRPSTHTSVDFQLPVSEKDLKPALPEDQLAQVPTWTVAIWPAWYSGTATGRPVLEAPFSEFHYASIRSLPAGDYLARVSMPSTETLGTRQWTEPTPFSIGSSDTVVVPIASLKVASVADWPK